MATTSGSHAPPGPELALNLPAGRYQVSATVPAYHLSVAQDVTLEAGKPAVASLDIPSGVVKFKPPPNEIATNGDIYWEVVDVTGAPVWRATGLEANTLLAPGHYTVRIEARGKHKEATFDVRAGQTQISRSGPDETERNNDGADASKSLRRKPARAIRAAPFHCEGSLGGDDDRLSALGLVPFLRRGTDPRWAAERQCLDPRYRHQDPQVGEHNHCRQNRRRSAALKLVALLTADGQQIDQGLIWRVFQMTGQTGKSKLIKESREASPSIQLQPGEYTVNAAFGRANLTRKIVVKPDGPPFESFVLNAGGLRLSAMIGGKPAPPGAVTYAIYSDDHDQFEGRTAVMNGAKPNLIIRLNSGIYRIVSLYGDANAKIESDVTVEAGKLTETTVTHTGGKVTFKLVTRSGGEAMPDTRWTVQTADGEIVKESVGALPTHILAPGKYIVTASSGGHLFKNSFEIKDGDVINVEVLMTAANEDRDESGSTDVLPSVEGTGTEGTSVGASAPTLDLKNP